MIKSFKLFELNDLDPYGEENWEGEKIFLVRANIAIIDGLPVPNRDAQNNKIIYVACNVMGEKEARNKLEEDTGVTDEYGELSFEETTKKDIITMIVDKQKRKNELDEEVDNLKEELMALRDAIR